MARFSFLLRLPVILGLAHLYVVLRLLPAVPHHGWYWTCASGLLASYLLIIGGFHVRRATGKPGADLLAWAGFLALGLFSWLFVLTLFRELLLAGAYWWNFTLRAGSYSPALMPGEPNPLAQSWRQWAASLGGLPGLSAAGVVLLSLLFLMVGLVNARRVAAVRRVDVRLDNLASAFDGYTIAQLSDVHVGPTIKRDYVRAIVARTNALDADMIVLTGDLIDGSVAQLRGDVAPLGDLTARDGVYMVTGNHEYYSGAVPWVEAFRTLGITVLMNEHRSIARDKSTLVIAGITDFGAEAFYPEQASDPQAALRHAPSHACARILLAHQPRSAQAAAAAGFNLQLSGHTHGGQFWPWAYLVPLQQPFIAGLHSYQGMKIYVSRGTGYWGPPMRIGARSEITLLRLLRA